AGPVAMPSASATDPEYEPQSEAEPKGSRHPVALAAAAPCPIDSAGVGQAAVGVLDGAGVRAARRLAVVARVRAAGTAAVVLVGRNLGCRHGIDQRRLERFGTFARPERCHGGSAVEVGGP